jgi:hypothetical protein
MQLKPAAENLLVRISRGPSTGITLSSDTQSYRIALALQRDGFVQFSRRTVATVSVRWLVRLTGTGEQAAARIVDSRVDEINRSEPV